MNPTRQLLSMTLFSLGLLACAGGSGTEDVDEASTSSESSDSLVRVDIEVVGEGQVAIDQPFFELCTMDEGFCTYYFERGQRIRFVGDQAVFTEDEETPVCEGGRPCEILVERDRLFTALVGEDASPRPRRDQRSRGILPEEPWFIVDPYLGGGNPQLSHELSGAVRASEQ